MGKDYSKLFTSFNIGKEQIKNRFVMGPMGGANFFDYRGKMQQEGIDFYVERAKGGFGLIVTGGMGVDIKVDNFNPLAGTSPLVSPSQFMLAAHTMNERCSAYGTKIIAEISLGVGRNYPGFKAPSPVDVFKYSDYKGIELTVDEIHEKTEQAVKAAALMKKSGFMGVDLHALHWGYLLDQFAMSITNHREDEYGGSLENRMRFFREIVEGIHQTCGDDFPVTVGLSVKSFIKGLNNPSLSGEEEAGRTIEEAIRISKMLEEMGIAAIMTDTGMYDSFYYACPPSYMPQGHGLPLYEQIKNAVNIPILARSRMGNADVCADAVNEGKCDAVVFARPSLADPFFPRKLENGHPEKIRPCIACNVGCIGPLLEKGLGAQCAVNPRAYNETSTKPKKSAAPRKIAVIGGGVGGMQAAVTAAECGHEVELFEKTQVLGGQLIAAGAHETKLEIRQLNAWFQNELKEKNVPIHLGTELTAADAKASGFDTVILATGAVPVMPKSIQGIDKAVSAVDCLEGKKPVGENIVLVGGGQIGCEATMELVDEGKKVTLVEALPDILSAEFCPQQHKMMLREMLYTSDSVNICTGSRLVAITDEGAIIENEEGQRTLQADTVVLSIGMRPNASLRPEFAGTGIDVYEVGSANRAGNIYKSVREAFEVVYNFD